MATPKVSMLENDELMYMILLKLLALYPRTIPYRGIHFTNFI